jgi:hypothetical protein
MMAIGTAAGDMLSEAKKTAVSRCCDTTCNLDLDIVTSARPSNLRKLPHAVCSGFNRVLRLFNVA